MIETLLSFCINHSTIIILFTGEVAVAEFTNEACRDGGVNPYDSLLFYCKIYEATLLRVVVPSGQQEIISLGDTVADVVLPTGYTAVSLDIIVIDDSKRNFNLTLSIDSASLLKDGYIRCDDTSAKGAQAKCRIGKQLPSLCSLH